MRPNEQEVQDHSSAYYANVRYRGYGLKYHAHVINGMLDEFPKTAKILDVGCGTGIISHLYPEHDITGVDISPEMLKFHPGKRQVAAIEKLPFPDNSFDIVVGRSILHHLPDAVAGIREIKRVLKPGGLLYLWETNASWLAEIIRGMTQHGDRFSEYHHSFSDLPELIGRHFNSCMEVKFEGFLAYPLFGFPDIINFSRFLFPFFESLVFVDEVISRVPLIKRMSFAVRIKARKA